MNSLSAEEAETKREDLTEEQKAVFDILRKPTLTEADKKRVKEIAIELLEELKKEKLKLTRCGRNQKHQQQLVYSFDSHRQPGRHMDWREILFRLLVFEF